MYAIRYAMYSELDAMLMLAMLCYAVCYVCVCEPKKISFIYYFYNFKIFQENLFEIFCKKREDYIG
jgi:hypothetical protein